MSCTPTAEEFDMRNRYVSVLIYQNVKNPESHGLDLVDTAFTMWAVLTTKFNWTSDLLTGLTLNWCHQA